LILLHLFELFAGFDLYDYIESNLHFFLLAVIEQQWMAISCLISIG
jgi:hypothetical protein